MTTGIEFLKPEKKKKGRGPGKKPALVYVSLRVPKEVVDFFNQHHPTTKQTKIREILTEYVDSLTNQGKSNDETNKDD